MKIERKIVLSNIFNMALIVLIGLFAIQSLNLILTKLRFVEIADDLNASFLEMRLSEKNYFLYRDESALFDIKNKINSTRESIGGVSDDISRAIGEDNLRQLLAHLGRYSDTVEDVRRNAENVQLENKAQGRGEKTEGVLRDHYHSGKKTGQ